MTDTMKTEQRREAFEKWWNEYPSIDGIAYRAAWSAWCAALDSQAAQAQPSGWPVEFREILDWRMCSDPWPGGDVTVIDEWLDAQSRELGYSDWIDACHTLQRLPASPSHSKEPGDGDHFPDTGKMIKKEAVDAGVQPTNASVPVAVLREHWLHAMECDHEAERDKPHCACSLVDLGWHPSVGAAVEAWLAHVAGVQPCPDCGGRGHGVFEGDQDEQCDTCDGTGKVAYGVEGLKR